MQLPKAGPASARRDPRRLVTAAWLVRRGLWSAAVLLAVAIATYALAVVLPVDPALAYVGPHAPPGAIEQARIDLGLNRPQLERLWDYLVRLLQGDLGYSYTFHVDARSLVGARLPATLELAVAALAIEIPLGIALGVAATVCRRPSARYLADFAAIVAVGAPSIWVGYLLLYLLAFAPQQALGIELLPVGGGYRWLDPRYVLLPALTLALPGIGTCARLLRTALADELRRDYVRAARAKGASESRVVLRHALRNALGPVVSELGLDLGSFVGGVVIVETVFSWPGVGQLAWQSITAHDTPVLMATVLLGALGFVLANLAADVVQVVADPRLARGA